MHLRHKIKTPGALKTQGAEQAFSATLIVVVLLILPPLGGTAMLIGSTIGLGAYILLFPDRFRTRRGSLRPALCVLGAFVLASLVILVGSLLRGHWN